jgi:hypothetical protein
MMSQIISAATRRVGLEEKLHRNRFEVLSSPVLYSDITATRSASDLEFQPCRIGVTLWQLRNKSNRHGYPYVDKATTSFPSQSSQWAMNPC